MFVLDAGAIVMFVPVRTWTTLLVRWRRRGLHLLVRNLDGDAAGVDVDVGILAAAVGEELSRLHGDAAVDVLPDVILAPLVWREAGHFFDGSRRSWPAKFDRPDFDAAERAADGLVPVDRLDDVATLPVRGRDWGGVPSCHHEHYHDHCRQWNCWEMRHVPVSAAEEMCGWTARLCI